MGRTQVKERFRRFKEKQKSLESVEGSDKPSISRNQLIIDKVRSAVLDNRTITIRELSDELEAFNYFGTVHSKKISA
jgi:hypothetical protein